MKEDPRQQETSRMPFQRKRIAMALCCVSYSVQTTSLPRLFDGWISVFWPALGFLYPSWHRLPVSQLAFGSLNPGQQLAPCILASRSSLYPSQHWAPCIPVSIWLPVTRLAWAPCILVSTWLPVSRPAWSPCITAGTWLPFSLTAHLGTSAWTQVQATLCYGEE